MAQSYQMTFDGKLFQRGFWLYVIKAIEPNGEALYYVGRTGDSSSNNAQSPFNRLMSHLNPKSKGNSLMKNLLAHGADLESLTFKIHFHGPMYPEQETFEEHKVYRDKVAVLEKEIANQLKQSGHRVMGTHGAPKSYETINQEIVTDIINKILVL